MLIVLVHNDGTGNVKIANYEVWINNEVIERGRIQGHDRKDGWQALIREIAEQSQSFAADPEKFGSLIVQSHNQAKAAGLKPSDVDRAVGRARELKRHKDHE